jgi:hypothetical protein
MFVHCSVNCCKRNTISLLPYYFKQCELFVGFLRGFPFHLTHLEGFFFLERCVLLAHKLCFSKFQVF